MPHPLQPSGLRTRGIPSHCSPHGVPLCCPPHCRVCVRHSRAGGVKDKNAHLCRPTVGSAPSRLVTSPRGHSGRSSTNLSRRRFRGPRSGLVGHRRRSRPTSPTAIHNSPERSHELNAGTAGLEHLTDFSIRTADLEKLKLLARREKTMSHTWSSLRTPSSPTRHSCTNASLQPVLPVQDRATRQPGKHTLTLRETV